MDKNIKVFIPREVKLPSMPNFISIGNEKVSVGDLSIGDLEIIGKAWAEAFVEHGLSKRRENNIPMNSVHEYHGTDDSGGCMGNTDDSGCMG